jgi:hypothetical protein
MWSNIIVLSLRTAERGYDKTHGNCILPCGHKVCDRKCPEHNIISCLIDILESEGLPPISEVHLDFVSSHIGLAVKSWSGITNFLREVH